MRLAFSTKIIIVTCIIALVAYLCWEEMDRGHLRRLFRSMYLSLAGLMSAGDENTMAPQSNEHRFLVIGKSGNGKSSLCNTLTGSLDFPTGRGLAATTRTLQLMDINRYGYRMRVVDTPDVTNVNMNAWDREEEVLKWRQVTKPYPTAVLLTVRCDVRYTAEEYAIYREIQRLWGDNTLSERLIVAFTFGDSQDLPLEEELPTVCPELKSVLNDASQRYILFDNKASTPLRDCKVQELLNLASTPSMQGGKISKVTYALGASSLISGLLFAATYTADKTSAAIFFGVACLLTGIGVVCMRFKEKMH